MKKIILIVLIVFLLFLAGCNNGFEKIKYSESDLALLRDAQASKSVSGGVTENVSQYTVAGKTQTVSDTNDITVLSSGVLNKVSSAAVTSNAPLFNSEEEIIFDDSTLQSIILNALKDPQIGINKQKVTIGDVSEVFKFQKIKFNCWAKSKTQFRYDINIEVNAYKTFPIILSTTYATPIKSLNALGKFYSLKSVTLYNTNMSEGDTIYNKPFDLDISGLFRQKGLKELIINNLAALDNPMPNISGVNLLTSYPLLDKLELRRCGLDASLTAQIKAKQTNAIIS